MSIELRFQPSTLNVLEDGELFVSGYVNKTNQPSEVLGGKQKFIEKIKKGAFKKALENRERDIDFLAEHDVKRILSSTRNGSLVLTEDEHGLYIEAVIAPTSWGKDAYTLIKSGILRNMSFGFKVLKDSWKRVDNGLLERTIEQLQLFEVSVVKEPAYSQSTIEARGIEVLHDIEIPLLPNKENEMEKVIELVETLLKKIDSLSSDVTELKTAQKQVEVRDKENITESNEPVEVADPVIEDIEKQEDEPQEPQAETETQVIEQDKPAEEVEEPKSEEIKVEEVTTEEIEKEITVDEPTAEAPIEEIQAEARSIDSDFDVILSKLNQLKQGEK